MRVRITLHEKEIPFDIVEEDLKNFSEKLRKMHPEAKVPVLVHARPNSEPKSGKIIYESAIITEYIEDSFPTPSLMPDNPGGRADVRLWTYWCNHFFKPDVDRFKYGTSRFTEKECEGSRERLIGHLDKLSGAFSLSGVETEFLLGDQFSLADIHVFPFFRQLSRINPEPEFIKNYPILVRWCEKVTGRESFKKTMAAK